MSAKQLKSIWEEQKLDIQANEIPDDEVFNAIKSLPKHFSANLVVDLAGTAVSYPSYQSSGSIAGLCGSAVATFVGNGVDLINADTFCNVCLAGQPVIGSGGLVVQVQTSDTDVSGNYTDPTSGLPQFPTWFSSGGLLWLNSGGVLGGTIPGAINQGGGLGNTAGVSGTANSGYFMASGFQVFAGFQRVGRYAR